MCLPTGCALKLLPVTYEGDLYYAAIKAAVIPNRRTDYMKPKTVD